MQHRAKKIKYCSGKFLINIMPEDKHWRADCPNYSSDKIKCMSNSFGKCKQTREAHLSQRPQRTPSLTHSQAFRFWTYIWEYKQIYLGNKYIWEFEDQGNSLKYLSKKTNSSLKHYAAGISLFLFPISAFLSFCFHTKHCNDIY